MSYRKIDEIRADMESTATELETLCQMDDPANQDKVFQLRDRSKELESELDAAEEYEKVKAEVLAERQKRGQVASQPPVASEPPKKEMIPAVAKSQKSKYFNSSEDAFVAGMWFAHKAGSSKAGEILAAQSIGTDNKGGFAVPDPLSNALINLLETRGVARQKCRRIVMSADTWAVPKLTAHATVYYPGEAAAITESDLTFAQVTMNATKIAALVKMSTEVQEDAVISMVDTVVESIAYSVATAEDQNLFIGVSGGVNANGIEGDSNVNDTNVANVGALALDDLTACQASIGSPVIGAMNEWYMHPTIYHATIRDLVDAAGGNSIREFEEMQRPMLYGYPVNFVSVMPDNTASTSGDMLVAFGDLSLACYFGDRRSWSFKLLEELYAENDQIGIIGTERIDTKVANPEILGKITIT